MFNRIRYHQQYQQLQASPKPGTGNIAAYVDRDPTTGQRKVQAADGGQYLTQYVSNSQPGSIMPITRPGTIGLPGYISQKPA